MTEKEELIREEAAYVWQSAYIHKGLFWPRDRAFRYADKKAGKYIYKKMVKYEMV